MEVRVQTLLLKVMQLLDRLVRQKQLCPPITTNRRYHTPPSLRFSAVPRRVSLSHRGTTRKQTQNHRYGDNRKMATGFAYRIYLFYVQQTTMTRHWPSPTICFAVIGQAC